MSIISTIARGATKKGALKGMSGMMVAGAAVDVGSELYFRRKEHPDEHMAASVAYAGAIGAAWTFFPGIMGVKLGADLASGIAEGVRNFERSAYDNYMGNGGSGFGKNKGFQYSDVGYTQRQRAIEAIKSSRINARSALSNEARSLHRF